MLFQFPKHRIADNIWFLSDKDFLIHGKIVLITLAISEKECNVYYHVVSDANHNHVITEKQVIDNVINIPSPKYMIKDVVKYKYTAVDNSIITAEGCIDSIQIHINDGVIETIYFMEDDLEYHILEEEIVGFSEASFNSVLVESTVE